MAITSHELEDLRYMLKTHGLAEADFELVDREVPWPACPEPHFVQGTVEVKHRPTGVVRVYDNGPGSSWVADFQTDVEHHVFDR